MSAPHVEARETRVEIPLPGGRFAFVEAQASPLNGEAYCALKVNVAKHLERSLHDALHAARLHEAVSDPRWRVRCVFTGLGSEQDAQAAELAAIVADWNARGMWMSGERKVLAFGCSSNWLEAERPIKALFVENASAEKLSADFHRACLETLRDAPDQGAALILLPAPPDDICAVLHEAVRAAHPQAHVREIDGLHALSGHPVSGRARRCATVWFPVIEGLAEADKLLSVEVAVQALSAAQPEGDPLCLAGHTQIDKAARQTSELISLVREADPHGSGNWNTHVRIQGEKQGNSWELALALADRIARGREFPAKGKLIATGALNRTRLGEVEHVEGIERKCALILRKLVKGDRVLLPESWRGLLPAGFMRAVQSKEASCALIRQAW